MNQQANFQFGLNLRDHGIDSVTANNFTWIERIRKVARHISETTGSVSADELRVYAQKNNDHPGHVNAWGGVFRGSEWLSVGRKQSTTPSCHARWIMVWKHVSN